MKKVTKRKPRRTKKSEEITPPSVSANTYYLTGKIQVDKNLDDNDMYWLVFSDYDRAGESEYFGFNEYQLKRLALAIGLMLPDKK